MKIRWKIIFGNNLFRINLHFFLIQHFLNSRNYYFQINIPSFKSKPKRIARIDSNSLSIVNSLDVLRNRLLLEIARKKAKQGVNRNRMMLSNLGKRSDVAGTSDNESKILLWNGYMQTVVKFFKTAAVHGNYLEKSFLY